MKHKTDVSVVMPILSPILGEELALAIIELRDVVKKEPLTEYAAKLQAREYLKCDDPRAAAEMQILRSWRAIKADWYLSEIRKQGFSQNRKRSPMDAARDFFGDSHDANWPLTIQH